jgi:hypothetical protein
MQDIGRQDRADASQGRRPFERIVAMSCLARLPEISCPKQGMQRICSAAAARGGGLHIVRGMEMWCHLERHFSGDGEQGKDRRSGVRGARGDLAWRRVGTRAGGWRLVRSAGCAVHRTSTSALVPSDPDSTVWPARVTAIGGAAMVRMERAFATLCMLA